MQFEETSFARYVAAAEAVPGMLRLACLLMDQIVTKTEECKERLRQQYKDIPNDENVRGIWQEIDQLVGTADITMLNLTERAEVLISYAHDFLLTGDIEIGKQVCSWAGQPAISFLAKLTEDIGALTDIDTVVKAHLDFLRSLENTLEGKGNDGSAKASA